MKKVVLNYLVIAAIAVSAAFVSSCGSSLKSTVGNFLYPENLLVGVWEGSYMANMGETGITLTVYKEGANFKATCDFYSLPGKTNAQTGKYLMNVSYDEAKKTYLLKAYEWVVHPSGYVYSDLEGTISGNVFSGTLSSGRNLTFRVVKK